MMIVEKLCLICNISKNITEFHCKNKKTGRMHHMCKSCFSAYSIQRWINKKKTCIDFMGGVCLDCNGEFHYSVYEFHHLDPKSKDLDWSNLRKRKQQTIEEELKKCVMLCANCHRLRHAMLHTNCINAVIVI